MTWLDIKIDEFICRIRDSNRLKIPIGPGGADNPTYWRWFVWKRNRFINCYLHNFLRDDEEDLHDHRMINISFLLQGSYDEERFMWMPEVGQPLPPTDFVHRPNHSIVFRLPSLPHRVVLLRDAEGKPLPSWSLFIGFPHWREWGFWCPRGRWVPWTEYIGAVDPTSPAYGKPGKGCDE